MWELKNISDVAEILSGGTPKSTVSEYWDGDVQWLTPKDMGKLKNENISSTSRTISQEGLSKSSAKIVPPKSVILSTRAPIGHLAINEVPMAFNQGCRGLTPSENLDVRYLFYFLKGSVRLLNELGTGAIFKELSKKALADVKIPLPPVNEQKRIVGILDEAFAGIDQAIANTEKNLQNARDLFESYLHNIFTQKGEGWAEKTLGEVVELAQGLAINAKTKHLLVASSSKPLLRIKDLRNNTHEQYVAEEGYPPNSEVCVDDVIYTRTGQVGLVFRGREGVLHNNTFKVSPNEQIDKSYMFWWLQGAQFKKKVLSLAERAAQPDITHKIFKAQTIIVPPMEFQLEAVKEIGNLEACNVELEVSYQKKLAALKELKQSLLQKAFTGELTSDRTEAA